MLKGCSVGEVENLGSAESRLPHSMPLGPGERVLSTGETSLDHGLFLKTCSGSVESLPLEPYG